jgi:hypothetical protein
MTETLRDDEDARMRAPARKVLVRQDELSGWLGDMDRYKAGGRGGGDRAMYLRLFNGGNYTVDRVIRGSFSIPNWSACLLGGIQPEPIQRVAKEAADDGLLQRFLYCVPAEGSDGEDRVPNYKALDQYKNLFSVISTLNPKKAKTLFPRVTYHAVEFHSDAQRYRKEIDDMAKALSAMPDTSQRLKSALGKWTGIYARLALTFHLIAIADAKAQGEQLPDYGVVTPETAKRATAYMRDILLPHLLRADALLFLSPQTGHARWIAGYILANEKARKNLRVEYRDLSRAYGPLRPPENRRELVEVMEVLEVMGWLRAEEPKNKNKSPVAWNINPVLHSKFASQAIAERERRTLAREEMQEAIRRYNEQKER